MERCPQLSYKVYNMTPFLLNAYMYVKYVCIYTCRKAKLYIEMLTITLESAYFLNFLIIMYLINKRHTTHKHYLGILRGKERKCVRKWSHANF